MMLGIEVIGKRGSGGVDEYREREKRRRTGGGL